MSEDRRSGVPDRRSNWKDAAVDRYIRETPSLRADFLKPILGELRALEDHLRREAQDRDLGLSGSMESAILDDCADRIERVREMFSQ
jgi:hypothetical protein